MKQNILIIAHFVWASIFITLITLAAYRSGNYGLMWWYLLPTFTTFCCLCCCSTDSRKGGKE